jgi:hypothetical protein
MLFEKRFGFFVKRFKTQPKETQPKETQPKETQAPLDNYRYPDPPGHRNQYYRFHVIL